MKHSLLNKPHFEKMTWSHFWEYYKFHVIFGVFALCLIGTLIYSIASNKAADLTIHFIGSPPVQQEKVEPVFEELLKNKITDADKDGTIRIDTLVKNLSNFRLSADDSGKEMKIIEWENEPTDADLLYVEKITLDLTAGEPALYIIDGSMMEVYMTQGVFAALDNLNLPENTAVLKGVSELDPDAEHIFGVSLAGNKKLKDLGVPVENKYIGVRVVNAGQEDDAALNQNYENAMTALKYILGV